MTPAAREELQNKYAYDIKNDPIYIGDAESGRKGYFCMGCGKQMQAVITKVENRASYFRHDASDVKLKGQCTYSDETYRHKLAKEKLLIGKRIKVPAVYKFSLDKNAPGLLLKNAETIEAFDAKAEVYFYEDENGNIRWEQNKKIDEKYLLIKPDITFFDTEGTPILFIEIVATHKPDRKKMLKLLHLGINTVSVTIPKSSPQEIEEVFNHTRNTKWLYNDEEANTPYVPISDRGPEGVPHFDEEQRKLFTESHKCRKAQIKNLIRAIRKSLESQLYRDIESRLKSEISRVEINAERLRYDLDLEETAYRTKLANRRVDIEKERASEDKLADARYRDLEGRYIKKREELEQDESRLLSAIRSTIRQIKSISGSPQECKEYLDNEIRSIEREEGNVELLINRVIDGRTVARRKFESAIERNREIIERSKRDTKSIPAEFSVREQDITEEYRRKEEVIERDIRQEEDQGEGLPERFRLAGDDLRARFDQLNQSTTEAIEREDFNQSTYLLTEYKNVLHGERLLNDLTEHQRSYKRLTEIREFIRSANYKNWL